MAKINLDGWVNALTNLGVLGKDKRLGAVAQYSQSNEIELEELYAADEMATKLVDKLPEEALRAGFKITNIDKDLAETIQTYMETKLQASAKLFEVWSKARLYGGAGLFMVGARTQDLKFPFMKGNPVIALHTLNRYELQTDYPSIQNDLTKPGYGLPTQYQFVPRTAVSAVNANQMIDCTHLIRFEGAKLPDRLFIQNNYWSDSILTKLTNAIRNYSTSHDSVAAIIQDFRIAVFKIKNLADQVASGDDQAIVTRLQLVDLGKSIARAVCIDADGEDFDYKTSSLAGLDQVLSKIEQRLIAGSNMPHTILMGESPSGSNATGNSTVLGWYDYVANQQKTYLKPKVVKLVEMVAAGLQIEVGGFDIEFNPLWQMDEKELVAMRKTQAETDEIYMNTQVIDPREVAVSRFGGDAYSYETEIDMSLREQGAVVAPEAPAQDPKEAMMNGTA